MNFIHISGLENNLNCSKKNNIILSWNLNNNYFENYKKKEIFYVSKIWQKNKFKIKKNIIKLRIKLLSQLYKELNLLHKINYSKKEWEILLEPWLNIYLSGIYFRWIIIDEFISVYKKFSYLEIKVKKEIPVFDTLQFKEFEDNNDIFNHLLIQDILKYKKFTKQKKTLKINFKLSNKFIYKIYKKIKNNFFFILYENIINKIFKIKILINVRTKKVNFLKLCFKLNNLPFKGLAIFNRNKLIDISNKDSFKKKKRLDLNLKPNNKNDFENYIFNKIKNDIPRIFIENFDDIQNLHKNKLTNTKAIISDTMHVYNPIFKSWLASRKNLNKDFKIITADHGGKYGGKQIYNLNESISLKSFKYQKKISKNQVSLPCLFLNKNDVNYNNKILLICKDVPKYPKNIFTGPICEEMNSETQEIKELLLNANHDIKDNLFVRPYLASKGWFPDKEFKKIIGLNKIIYSNNLYYKLRDEAMIKIVTYPQTAFLECVINGPTFLLFNPLHYSESKENEKYMNILFKNKVAFKNGKELAIHINNIGSDVFSWWRQKKIQKSIDLFINNINIFSEDPIPIWAKNIKKIIKI